MALTKAFPRMIEGASISVKDFGAACDGVTDDSSALQAAVDFCKLNNKVLIIQGQMLIGSAVTIDVPLFDTVSAMFTPSSLVTIQNNDYVRPEWFGALGDGLNDDTAAFQAAMDQMGSDTASSGLSRISDLPGPFLQLSAPTVYYKITSQLNCTRRLPVIRGVGQSSLVRFVPTTSGLICFNFSAQFSTVELSDFCVHGAGKSDTELVDVGDDDATGIFLDNVGFSCLRNIYIANFHEGVGLELGESNYRGTYININVSRCKTNIKIGNEDASATSTNVHTFLGGSCRRQGDASAIAESGSDAEKYGMMKTDGGIKIANAQLIMVNGMTFEGNKCASVLSIRAAEIRFENCWFEANNKFFTPGDSEAVADASFEAKIDHFLYAEGAPGVISQINNVAISNYQIVNCKVDQAELSAWATSTRKIQGILFENCYGGQFGANNLRSNGFVSGIKILSLSEKTNEFSERNNLNPVVRLSNHLGSYPDFPVVYHEVNGMKIPANIVEQPVLAGTDGFILDSAVSNTTGVVNIKFDSSMSAPTINDKIEALPKELSGEIRYNLNFADGTYTLGSPINVQSFYGAGQITLNGNLSESGLHTNQAVIFDSDGQTLNRAVLIDKCRANVSVRNIKAIADLESDGGVIKAINCVEVGVNGCYVVGTSKTGSGIYLQQVGVGIIQDNYVDNLNRGINVIRCSSTFSENNDDTGTTPDFGLRADAGVIMKNSTQPSGSTANEQTVNGGVIR